MSRTKKWLRAGLFLFALTGAVIFTDATAEAKTYTVKTSTKLGKEELKKLKKKKKYSKKLRQWYVIQAALDKAGKKGGTVKLKKGTYKIPRTLYIPSNVKLKLANGCKINKTNSTGNKKLKSQKYLFEFVSSALSKKSKKVSGYGASANSSITGSGTAKINMKKLSNHVAIYAGHASNIKISNVTFSGKNGGSYVWIEGSKNVSVSKCTFNKGTAGTAYNKQMYIRLEDINSTISAFSGKWSKKDNTINNGITISGNTFKSSEIGVGSYAFVSSSTKIYYQKNIAIKDNTFSNTSKFSIYGNGWYKPTITGNMMTQSGSGKAEVYVKLLGTKGPSITGNTFNGCQYPIMLGTSINYGKGTNFPVVASTIGTTKLAALQNNTVANITYYYVLNDKTRILYFKDVSKTSFTITPTTAPYQDKYTEQANFSEKKYFYTFQSYMEQLELTGGGTITVKKGTYPITNNICVPSNVTIKLEDGVVFEKSGTVSKDVAYAKAIFALVAPSKDSANGTVTEYNGSQNVTIKGSGTVVIDCRNILVAQGVIMGHAQNVLLEGITFQNLYGYHYIELNSSKNVTVKNCKFIGFKINDEKSHKECINIDGTDENTNGFNYKWSAHDKTMCKDIFIQNNTFTNVGTAIGTHT
nr:hypothetical protein [Eubacterium sp.]